MHVVIPLLPHICSLCDAELSTGTTFNLVWQQVMITLYLLLNHKSFFWGGGGMFIALKFVVQRYTWIQE